MVHDMTLAGTILIDTRSSANAERPRDALCQLRSY